MKAFGEDAHRAAARLEAMGVREYQLGQMGSGKTAVLTCHPRYYDGLKKGGIAVLLSWNVVEKRPQGLVIRELKLT